MQKVDHSVSTKTSEDVIAEKILKRVRIAKLTRQLKSRLFKAGLKVRVSQGKLAPESVDAVLAPELSSSPLKGPPPEISHQSARKRNVPVKLSEAASLPITPVKRHSKSESKEDRELSYSSPTKKSRSNANIPSSPFYVTSSPSASNDMVTRTSMLSNLQNSTETSTVQNSSVPQTPPPNKFASLNTTPSIKTPSGIKHGLSYHGNKRASAPSNVAGILSTPKASVINKTKDFTTPTSKFINDNEEGADLLLYLSNSPARTATSNKDSKEYNSYINIPSTPKASTSALQFSSTPTFNLESTPPRSVNLLPIPYSTPSAVLSSQSRLENSNPAMLPLLGTPNGTSKFHSPATPNNKLAMGANNKTPAFSMSDYVNIFTPSPRYSKTPEIGHGFPKPASSTKDASK
ncbi:hypothetical protein HII12_005326 [Brettanomyces bruxellensis]|uniref:Uncharacterized protein n=1 Tax=Dekkera bruxellensis TaxID=5007 RepID=A0A8H6EPR7_DEKBR|nr:hypothetical protein HII12_005326 [Brettanomyces bruxellensis]